MFGWLMGYNSYTFRQEECGRVTSFFLDYNPSLLPPPCLIFYNSFESVFKKATWLKLLFEKPKCVVD